MDEKGRPRKAIDARAPETEISFNQDPGHALSIGYDFRSICLFVTTFTTGADAQSGDPGHMDFLPSLLLRSANESCLQKATLALSLRNFANRHAVTDLTSKITEAYSEALKSTNQALADQYLAKHDGTLAAVFLLSLYESLAPRAVRGSWKAHVHGALQLLRLRGPEQFSTSAGQQLFRLVHTPILLRAFKNGEEPPEESRQMVQLFQMYHLPHHFASQISTYFYKVVMLRARTAKLLRQPYTFGESIFALDGDFQRSLFLLIVQGQALDTSSDFIGWAAEDDHWRLQKKSFSHEPARCYEKRYHKYYWCSHWAMCQWIRGWTARLYLYETLLNALSYLNASSLRDLADTASISDIFQGKVQETADNILCSIDFAFGDIDECGLTKEHDTFMTDPAASAVGPYYIFYGLEVIIESFFTTRGQKVIAAKALGRIGRERGLARLLCWT